MRLGLAAAAALSVVALGACQKTESAGAVRERAVAYVLAHPDALKELNDKLDAKAVSDQAAAEVQELAKARAALPKYRQALERDPRDFVANPGGKITVTEFYDYRCPHCVNVAPKVVDLIQHNPDVRFVFKEMPIFGAPSEHGARAALAVRRSGGDYVGFYAAMKAGAVADETQIDPLAAAKGASPALLKSPAEQAESNRQLADTKRLFDGLSLTGTPSFVVGDQVIPGEDIAAVTAAIDQERAKGA